MQPMQVPPKDPATSLTNVIVDTPGGSPNKFKFDEKLRLFRVSRQLPDGMVFPADFGSVPGTRAEDGDPLDVLVLGLRPTFPGCLITVRLVGVLHAYQIERGKKVRNDRLIGVAETPVNRAPWNTLAQLPARQLEDIEHFFVAYNAAQGREFRITGRGDRRMAQAALKRAISAFRASKTVSAQVGQRV